MSKPFSSGKLRYPRYQDYVIKDGRFVGEFKRMYRDFDDPWEQTTAEVDATEKDLGIALLVSNGVERVVELGCGLGAYSACLANAGMTVRGVDVSTTAIDRARGCYPEIDFVAGDVLDSDLYRAFERDAVVMAEITWYILDKVDDLLEGLRHELPGRYLLHLLHTYPSGVQEYGRDKLPDLESILAYFGLDYVE